MPFTKEGFDEITAATARHIRPAPFGGALLSHLLYSDTRKPGWLARLRLWARGLIARVAARPDASPLLLSERAPPTDRPTTITLVGYDQYGRATSEVVDMTTTPRVSGIDKATNKWWTTPRVPSVEERAADFHRRVKAAEPNAVIEVDGDDGQFSALRAYVTAAAYRHYHTDADGIECEFVTFGGRVLRCDIVEGA